MQDAEHSSSWMTVLIKAAVVFVALIISNFLIVYLFGPQIWSSFGYFFGSDMRTTLSILLFVEGAVLLLLGSLWSMGSSENESYGIYRKKYGALSKESWETRKKRTEKPENVIKILLSDCGFALVTCFLLLLI